MFWGENRVFWVNLYFLCNFKITLCNKWSQLHQSIYPCYMTKKHYKTQFKLSIIHLKRNKKEKALKIECWRRTRNIRKWVFQVKNKNILLFKLSHFIFKFIVLILQERSQKVRRRGKLEWVLGERSWALCFWSCGAMACWKCNKTMELSENKSPSLSRPTGYFWRKVYF